MDLAPGTRIADRFEITGPPLGAGSSGVVWPATDRATGRAVAVKLLHPHRADDPRALARLQAEAGLAGRLRHPHVVEVIGLWSVGEGADAASRPAWALVTERVEDAVPVSSLPTPLAPEAVAALGVQLADALAAAAEAGLVHGDVRPGNVLVGPRGAMLFDFGVGAGELRPGETAPEVIDGGPPGPVADLYGLGVTLYRALHGRLPFSGPTPYAVMGAQRAPVEVEGPRGLAALVAVLLRPDPASRPQELHQVRAALERLRDDPGRRLRLARPTPAFRPGSAWVVHGTDPATGGPALVRAGVSAGEARGLVARLRREGWDVRATREALALPDLAWIAVLAAIGAVVLPLVGALPAGWLAARWRTSKVRPSLRRALPAVRAPVPPRPMAEGTESATVAGLLLLATAALLAWWPALALVPLALLIALGAWSWRTRRVDPEALVREGRVRAALADLRAAVEARALGIEEALGATGEIEALEAAWEAGEAAPDDVLSRAEALTGRLAARGASAGSARTAAPPASAVLEALRRTKESG